MVRVWEEGVSVKGAWVRVCVYICMIVWGGIGDMRRMRVCRGA